MDDWQRRARTYHKTVEHDAGPATIDVVRWTSQYRVLDQRLGLPKYRKLRSVVIPAGWAGQCLLAHLGDFE